METIEDIHREVDEQSSALHQLHRKQMQCKLGCRQCCVDDITVFEMEAALIRRHHRELLEQEKAHPKGACAFLDEAGACRIYPERPYVCRTQGLPLRWVEEEGDEGGVEYRDVCPLNMTGVDLTALEEGTCWTLGPIEGRLAELQRTTQKSFELTRVQLRDLFKERCY